MTNHEEIIYIKTMKNTSGTSHHVMCIVAISEARETSQDGLKRQDRKDKGDTYSV